MKKLFWLCLGLMAGGALFMAISAAAPLSIVGLILILLGLLGIIILKFVEFIR